MLDGWKRHADRRAIRARANVNTYNSDDVDDVMIVRARRTPAHWAAENGHADALQLLVVAGQDSVRSLEQMKHINVMVRFRQDNSIHNLESTFFRRYLRPLLR